MGHLVNPMGFRLGFLDSWVWSDFWCVKRLYYSEYLYNIYRMREELNWLFSGPTFFKLGFLYSHFSMHKKYNKYYVYIFLYDGTVEQWIDKALADFLLVESENSKFPLFSDQHEMVSSIMSRFFNVFIGNLCYYSTSQYDTWIFKTEDYMPKLPQLYDHDTSVLMEGSYRYGTHGVSRLLLFKFSSSYIILRHILVDSLLPGWQSLFMFKVLLGSDFLTGLSVHVRMGCQEPFFAFVSLWMSFAFLDSYSLLKTSVLFLGMSNSEVTSFMLTSYMGVQMFEGMTLWDLITPLRREFKFLGQLERGRLLGFKLHFCGRFSRKQRASSIWVVSGALPLNSIGVFIDYSFSEVVMMNSMCSLKVWLYSSEGFSTYTYSLNS